MLRGWAIIEMIFYHFMWDLSFFGVIQTTLVVGPWQWFARSIATLFLFTMGVSMTLSFNRERHRLGHDKLFGKYVQRGLTIFGWGMVITVATYFFIGEGFVIFGVLHVLGASMVLAYPFLKLNRWVGLVAGIGIIIAGIYIDGLRSESVWLVWLGIKQSGRTMVDYYPMLPYSGIALIGVFAGHTLYPNGRRSFSLPTTWSRAAPVRGLQFLGRHSLLIYLIHQPIIIGIFMLLGF